jgi:arylsulfatase A-like enzyme
VVAVAAVALAGLLPTRRLLRRVPDWAAVVGLVLVAVAAVGATHRSEPARPATAPAAGDRPNVVLVLIDTLRADHLGAYGYTRPTSPNLDAFAADAVLFTRAFSQSSWTKPAMASLLTSHYPSTHQTNLEQQALPASEVLLTQLLRAQGYATAVFSGNPWITPDYGFDRGVDHFYSVYDERFARVTLFMTSLKRLAPRVYNRAKKLVQGDLSTTARDEAISAAAFQWLDAHHGAPFYVHLHMMSPHHPYDPPPPYDRFVPDPSIPPMKGYPEKSYYFFDHGAPVSPAQLADMIARYDGDILFADTIFGRVLEKLRGLGQLDRTIVVVASDHGEEFYDHQNWGHGQSIYNELINVPLIVRYPPAMPAGTRVEQTVMLVDVVPTLLELVGAPPKPSAAGASLVPLVRGAMETRVPQAFSELVYRWGAARGVVDGAWKLIDASVGDEKRRQLFDLQTDFHERDDRLGREPSVASSLQQRLDAVRDEAAAHGATAADAPLDDEARKRLEALGYLR